MLIPSLFSNANPNAPRWAVPVLDPVETRRLSARVAMVVCPHPTTQEIVQWGSGVIVAAVPDGMWIATSAHLFTDWLDHAQPSARSAVTGLGAIAARLKRFLDDGVFRIIVDFGAPVGRRSCRLGVASFGDRSAKDDVALLHVAYPAGIQPSDVTIMPLDFEAFPVWAPVIIAGYSGAEIHVDYDKGRTDEYTDAATAHLHCRVGHIVESAKATNTLNGRMYGLGIPSLAGMTGGPVILDRNMIESVSRLFPRRGRYPLTVIGIVSRDGGSASLLDTCRDGKTWASPISDAMELAVAQSRSLKDAVERGQIGILKTKSLARGA